MRIITDTCPKCETIVAANVLESERVMKCPGLQCEEILAFEDLAPEDQEFVRQHVDRFRI